MIYTRQLKSQIESRLNETMPLIQVIIGPRQVGKTTAIKQALNGRGLFETADSPTPLHADQIDLWWDEALKTKDKILAIDEVQKISGWSEAVKKKWDHSRAKKSDHLKLLISGSAALAIEKNLKESLAGRYELIRAEHWNFSEAKKIFNMNVKQFIEYGCYPGSMSLIKNVARWGDYIRDSIIEPVIGRDILQLHPVQNPALLRQVFGYATSNPAQQISLNKLQGQIQDKGSVATIQHYLDLLSHGFLITSLQKYSRSLIRAKKSSPKLIVHDNALVRSLERPVERELTSERFGRYFENAVAARFIESGWETFYWNERDLDVDLVVHGPGGEKLAIEVKSSLISKPELKGLEIFCKRNPDFQPCLISYQNQKIEGIKTWLVEEVLSLGRSFN